MVQTVVVLATLFVTVLAGITPIDRTALDSQAPQQSWKSWAQYSPWFPAATYAPPPTGCRVVQVNLLQRHGARYPEPAAGKAFKACVEKIKHATEFKDPKLAFVRNYNYTLGTADLVPFGAAQSREAGHDHFLRYASLITKDNLPFIRASQSDRVIDSAWNWSAGFAEASKHMYVPKVSLIISEAPSSNNTLDDRMCPAKKYGNESQTWMDIFAPAITKRINAAAPGANLNNREVVNLMSLCPFDTVAHEAPHALSPWCDVFTSDEWGSYEYQNDLRGYYGSGYGQKLGRVQGVGYVNELLARLTGKPVQDETQTNHTLDGSPATFPLNHTFYADFSHDNQMLSIYSALGLFVQPHNLDPKHLEKWRTWVESKMVPFSGRIITEKLACDSANKTGGREPGEYVRVLVNDVVQPLACSGAGGDGLCTLVNFVASQSYARNDGEGDWPLCKKA